MKIRNVAHRGLWDETVPQNTLEAFRRAWDAGATWVETDFHHTRAGQMLCIHAEGELRRYTGCEKKIADLGPDEVAALRLDPVRFARSESAHSRSESAHSRSEPAHSCSVPAHSCAGFRIPFLDEVLATVPPHGTLQAEIKGYSPRYADLFDDAVRAAGLTEDNIVVSSFQRDALADFHARKPSYRTLLLVGVPKDRETDVFAAIAAAKAAGFDFFCPGLTPGDRPLTPDERAAVRDAGLGFRVYGVNSPEALAEAARLGAAAFTCNYWRQAFDWARDLGGIELLA